VLYGIAPSNSFVKLRPKGNHHPNLSIAAFTVPVTSLHPLQRRGRPRFLASNPLPAPKNGHLFLLPPFGISLSQAGAEREKGMKKGRKKENIAAVLHKSQWC